MIDDINWKKRRSMKYRLYKHFKRSHYYSFLHNHHSPAHSYYHFLLLLLPLNVFLPRFSITWDEEK
jgi:hypothetical protein